MSLSIQNTEEMNKRNEICQRDAQATVNRAPEDHPDIRVQKTRGRGASVSRFAYRLRATRGLLLLLVLATTTCGQAVVEIGTGRCRVSSCYACWGPGHGVGRRSYCGWSRDQCRNYCTRSRGCTAVAYAHRDTGHMAAHAPCSGRGSYCITFMGSTTLPATSTYWGHTPHYKCYSDGRGTPCANKNRANWCNGHGIPSGHATSRTCGCTCDPGYIAQHRCGRSVCHGRTRQSYCANRGTPTVVGSACACRGCTNGYTGARCERPPCHGRTRANFCNNHGHPIVSNSRCVCSCTHGYTGNRCERNACHGRTRSNFCSGRGEPVLDGLTCTCRRCTGGYTGARCDRSPCHGHTSGSRCNGRGTPYVTRSTCLCRACRSGYHGNFCERNVCYGRTRTNWCNNRGIPTIEGPACRCWMCIGGYTGTRCQNGPPTQRPTASPTTSPTSRPTTSPTRHPTAAPSASPTRHPSVSPTLHPTVSPTWRPTVSPTRAPTRLPTPAPTNATTSAPDNLDVKMAKGSQSSELTSDAHEVTWDLKVVLGLLVVFVLAGTYAACTISKNTTSTDGEECETEEDAGDVEMQGAWTTAVDAEVFVPPTPSHDMNIQRWQSGRRVRLQVDITGDDSDDPAVGETSPMSEGANDTLAYGSCGDAHCDEEQGELGHKM